MEEFRPIKEFPGYFVSNQGAVRKGAECPTCHHGGRVLRQFEQQDGTFTVTLMGPNGRQANRHVHRLVGLAFLPNPKNHPYVKHKGSKQNNAPENLYWAMCPKRLTKDDLEFDPWEHSKPGSRY